MEYILFSIVVICFLIVLFAGEAIRARKNEKAFIASLRTQYGVLPKKRNQEELWHHVDGYYKRHRMDGQIDDITWNDLELDEIFRILDYCYSAAGEEYLYCVLRSVGAGKKELEHLEDVVTFFAEKEDVRVKVQYLMHRLGSTGKYSLYDYLDNFDVLGKRSNLRIYFLDALFFLGIAWIPFHVSEGLLFTSAIAVINILSYFREKHEIEPFIVNFSYLSRVVRCGKKLQKLSVEPMAEEWESMKECLNKLTFMERATFWLSDKASLSPSGGNPLEILFDYLRMLFHIDVIVFNLKLSRLKKHISETDRLVGLIGYIETCIAIGAFRKAKQDVCVPVLEGDHLEAKDVYHPLLTNPVKNSVSTSGCVLLTGSNASGKSTFLKTIALNAILAQTIHTCLASSYQSPLFEIYSSMSIRDNLQNRESYYIVEIKSIKRILDAAACNGRKVLCFVDEVLRGTNTLERIAASTQILKYFKEQGVFCFAATHDMELTELLKMDYSNYHFEERFEEGDIIFPYRLLDGPASTRNAIRLLETIGYPKEIIDGSVKQADSFTQEGVWMMP